MTTCYSELPAILLAFGIRTHMERFGVAIGVLLLALVTAIALAIGRRAAASVKAFREEKHTRFTGRDAS
jgi:hypothetical protein